VGKKEVKKEKYMGPKELKGVATTLLRNSPPLKTFLLCQKGILPEEGTRTICAPC